MMTNLDFSFFYSYFLESNVLFRVLLVSFFEGNPSFSPQGGKGEEILMINLFRLASDTLNRK